LSEADAGSREKTCRKKKLDAAGDAVFRAKRDRHLTSIGYSQGVWWSLTSDHGN
jgi:hypothetical protein